MMLCLFCLYWLSIYFTFIRKHNPFSPPWEKIVPFFLRPLGLTGLTSLPDLGRAQEPGLANQTTPHPAGHGEWFREGQVTKAHAMRLNPEIFLGNIGIEVYFLY